MEVVHAPAELDIRIVPNPAQLDCTVDKAMKVLCRML